MSDIKYFTFNNIIIIFLIFIIIIQIFNIKIFTSNSNSMEPFTSNSNSMEPYTSSISDYTNNNYSKSDINSNKNILSNSNEKILIPLTLLEILSPIKSNILFLLDASLQNTYSSLQNTYSSLQPNYSSLQPNYSSLNLNNTFNSTILTKTYSQPTFNNNSIILNDSTGGLVIKNVIINNYDFAFYIVCNLSVTTSSNKKNTDYCLLNFGNDKIYIGTDNITINTFYNFISYDDLLINNNKIIISGLISDNKFYLFNMNKIIVWKQFTDNKFNNYDTPIDIFIGSNKSGRAIFPGSIYEIIIFNKNINVADHKNIILALTNKWNITSESTIHLI